MKTKISFLAIIFIFATLACNAQETINSNWPKTKIVCDGALNDWDLPLRLCEKNLQYDITNDSSTLYIAIKALDQAMSLKLMNGGLKIWLNAQGKKKEVSYISLIRPLPSENINTSLERGQKPDKERLEQLFIADKKEINIKGFPPIPDGNLPLDNAQNIRAGVAFDGEGRLIYEFALPLDLLRVPGSKNFNFQNTIAIEYEIDGIKKPENHDPGYRPDGGGMDVGMAGGRGGMGGGRGGRHGGGHSQSGEGNRSGSNGFANLFSTDHIWNTLKINLNKQ